MNRISAVILLSLLSFFGGLHAFATGDTINIGNLKSGVEFGDNWKFSNGDDPNWASVTFNDSSWKSLKNETAIDLTSPDIHRGVTWYRSTYYSDSILQGIPLAFEVYIFGAADVFVDGHLIYSLGKVGHSLNEEKSGFSAKPAIVPVPFSNSGLHHIAMRTSNYGLTLKLRLLKVTGSGIKNFELKILSMRQALENQSEISEQVIPVFFCGVFIVLSLFHLILFLYYRKNRSNLYYSLFTFFLFAIFFGVYLTFSGADFQTTKFLIEVIVLSIYVSPLFYIGILYEVFYNRLTRRFWILAGVLSIALILVFFLDKKLIGIGILFFYSFAIFIESIRVIIQAVRKKREGAWVFVFGLIFPIMGSIALTFIAYLLEKFGYSFLADQISDHIGEFFAYSFLMSVSISMTIYLARDFAKMNKKLNAQIREIKTLLDRTIFQENEKKKILENQKADLEKMVVIRTEEVVSQKAELEVKNKDILDNLLYAKRIQDAILPEIRLIYEALTESFIIYKPKDIVSGDFYSFSQRNEKVIISAADCTGHGVTGAFMSMIGSSALNQIINEKGITTPSHVLNQLNIGITEALKQSQNDMNDGMDICLCSIDLQTHVLQYAGANRPLWLIRNGEMSIIKPDKAAIGGFHIHDTVFTNHEIALNKGDLIYMCTDGFADQFGGKDGKKLLSKRFREKLLAIRELPMREQEKILTAFFNEWKGKEVQVDDVLVIGIRI